MTGCVSDQRWLRWIVNGGVGSSLCVSNHRWLCRIIAGFVSGHGWVGSPFDVCRFIAGCDLSLAVRQIIAD